MTEQWKNINTLDGLSTFLNYQVSSLGNVRSKYRLLKQSIDGAGYLKVVIKGKNLNIHRLVALLFIDNPDKLPCVDHKYGNKLNNSVENLRWCSYSQNSQNSIRYSSTGEKNISIDMPRKKDGCIVYWVVSIKYDGVFYRDRFPKTTDYIPEHVIKHRDKMLSELHQDFASVRINHQ